MAVAGALIGGAIGAFGRKPEIPELPTIDPNAIQQATIASNQGALPQAQALAGSVNDFNFQQVQANFRKALEQIAPGALAKVQGITNSQLAGEIPADVQNSVLRSGAARQLAGGVAGSQLGRNLTLRDLGLTSLGIQQQGIGNFQALAAMAPQTPLMNVSSMFFSPQQRLDFAFQQNQAQFQRNLLNEQIKAAPDPATAALGKEIDRFFNTAAGAGMMAAGGGMGGGGGMPGG